MKYLKMLGLAAVAAAALMAFVGSSTASATVLCNVEGTGAPTGTTCPAGHAYPAGTKIEGHLTAGTEAKLTTTFLTIKCTESTVKGEINAEEAEPLTGPEGLVTFGGCNCEVFVLHSGTLSTSWINVEGKGSHNGTVKSTGSEVTTLCHNVPFLGDVHCIYKTNATDLGTLKGGNPAKLEAASVGIPRLTTDPECANQSNWDATYEVTSPKPLFVAGHT